MQPMPERWISCCAVLRRLLLKQRGLQRLRGCRTELPSAGIAGCAHSLLAPLVFYGEALHVEVWKEEIWFDRVVMYFEDGLGYACKGGKPVQEPRCLCVAAR